MFERRIPSLERGEAGFTTPWAAWIEGGQMYLHGDYPLSETPDGTKQLRLLRDVDGRILVDMSTFAEPPETRYSFGPNIRRVKIDEALNAPLPSIRHRIYDLVRGDCAYVKADDVWIFEGRRMWLNGYTYTSDQLTEETPVRLVRDRRHGSYQVDLTYCNGLTYPTSPPDDAFMFPIQVHRRIG